MARLLEDQTLALLTELEIPVPAYTVATTPEEAETAASVLEKEVVLKALIPAGKRGKAGAVKFAATPTEAKERARQLLGMKVAQYKVERLLVAEKLDVRREMYLSLTIDPGRRRPVIILSALGGVEIEELARERPDQIFRIEVNPLEGLPEFKIREVWAAAGLTGRALLQAAALTHRLYQVFVQHDAYILEINPLVETGEGEIMPVAAVMAVDDAALYRQPDLSGWVQSGQERAWHPLTAREKAAVEVNEADPYRGTARYTEMDEGDIGFMCGGGGGSLLLFDAIVAAGGKPANYSEFGGNPSEEKCYGLAKVILSRPGLKGLIVAQNITNNSQTDVQARGIIRAIQELKLDPRTFPIVIRQAGVNEVEAKKLYADAGIEFHGDDLTLTEAANLIVRKVLAAGATKEGGQH